MIFTLLSLCFASVRLEPIQPAEYASTVFAHVQEGANLSFKTFNPVAILKDKFASRFGKDPRTPHLVFDGSKAIGVILFGYWGSGEAQKEHWDLLPFEQAAYQKFDEIIGAALTWYQGKEIKSELILSFHPQRCGSDLTEAKGWKIEAGKSDDLTIKWMNPDQRNEIAFSGSVGPLVQAETAFVGARTWFTRTLKAAVAAGA